MNAIIRELETTLNILDGRARGLGEDVFNVCQGVLSDERFKFWSGSSRPYQHHYGAGGLAKHTLEVVNLCNDVTHYYSGRYDVDPVELFFAAFFHDVGKMYDYEPVDGYDIWKSAEHKRLVHHISRSAVIWTQEVSEYPEVYEKYHEKVLHAILAHHGMRSAGSPVAPKSRVAWLVHFCDGISARMFDADTLDIVKVNRERDSK